MAGSLNRRLTGPPMLVLVGGMLVLVSVGLLSSAFAAVVADGYELPFPLAYYTLTFRLSPFGLIFGLLAAFPYGLHFNALLHNRQLTYARLRQPVATLISRHYRHAAVTTGAVFGALALSVGAWVAAFPARYSSLDLTTAAQLRHAEASWTTFSQVTKLGGWGWFVAIYAAWLASNAAVYAHATVSVALLTNRRWSILLPWMASFTAGVLCAYLGLETVSPFTIMPFNLEQVDMWRPLVSLLAAALVAFVLRMVVARRLQGLECLQ